MTSEHLDQPVTCAKGIGPARAASLAEYGILTLKDLLLCLPRRYNERPAPQPMDRLEEGQSLATRGVVERVRVSGRGRRRNLIVQVRDKEDAVQLILFNRGYLKSSFKKGRTVTFQGKVTLHKDTLQVLSPDYHLEGDPGQGFPGLIPAYSLPPGLFPRTFHRIIDEILAMMEPDADQDWRDEAGLPMRELLPLEQALRAAHRPASLDEAEAARRRLAYEEFFAFQVGLALQRKAREEAFLANGTVSTKAANPQNRKRRTSGTNPAGCTNRKGSSTFAKVDAHYQKCLPFQLTDAQKTAVSEIRCDLESLLPMHRLLQGDVGSGKTVVAIYPLLAAALQGGQGALMAPTEVLARQHHEVLDTFFKPIGIAPVFLPAGLSARAVRETLEDPKAQIIIGTHALIQDRVVFNDLRVCVIDEQHKFGVRQRWNLKQKGADPEVLVMTATPIPRSLALTLYGELDVTTLNSLPPGRQPIDTFSVSGLNDQELLRWLDEEIDTGGRVFFVCPLVNASEKLDLQAAVKLHGHVERKYRSKCRTELLHGGMPAQAKDRALESFRTGQARLLVTTVVVEVGVDVPEASTVVILDAWRFGLAQLHQIRGRVGRGRRSSRCYLVGEPSTDSGKERVRILERTTDGFEIAEEDLKMRGPGEALGLKQHGLPALRAGDYIADIDLMTAARDDARLYVATNPQPDVNELLMYAATQNPTWIG